MNPGIQNPTDRPTRPVAGEQAAADPARQQRRSPVETSRHEVMNTLLGDNNLAAFDAYGGDPYNATGRHLRR
jgi:hypothetical protein